MRKLWKCGLARRIAAGVSAIGAIAVTMPLAMPVALQADEPSSGWLAEAYERAASVDGDSEAVDETDASQQGIATDDVDVTAGDLAEIYAEFAAFQPRGGERGRGERGGGGGDRGGGRGREDRDHRGGPRGHERGRDNDRRDGDRREGDRHAGPRRGGPPQWHAGGGPGRAQGRGYRGGPPAMNFNRSGARSFGPQGFGPGFGHGFGAGGPQSHADINARLARIERKLDLLIAQSRGRGPAQARGGRPGGDRPAVGGGSPIGGFEGALGILGGGGGPRPDARAPQRGSERSEERRGGGRGGPGGRGPEGRRPEGRGTDGPGRGGPGARGGGSFGGFAAPGGIGNFGGGFGGGGFGPPAGPGFGRPGGESGKGDRKDDNEDRRGGRGRDSEERRPRGERGDRTT